MQEGTAQRGSRLSSTRIVRVLVTGGAGFIGSHLARRLMERGASVRIIDNFATGRRENLAVLDGEVEVIEGDIQSSDRIHRAISGCDLVFHEAALPSVPRSIQDPLTSNATNVVGTLNVLLAARDHGVQRVIVASSSSVYGANLKLPMHEDDPTLPISPYATAKLASENYTRSFHHVYGLETVVLRYFNVFGPRQDPGSEYSAVIPRFIARLAAGEAPVIYGDGEQSRDFTYVDNVVAANLLAAEAPQAAGSVYNIACGEQTTLKRLLTELQTIIGTDIAAAYAAPRAGEVRHSLADITKAREELGYEPSVGLSDGLRRAAHSLLSDSALRAG
jgi:nucleoside-diphosphate-sugar epimerase